MPLILISNDDGIQVEGIHRLVDAVAPLGQVVVVAPDAPRSGGSHSITCNNLLRPKRIDDYNGAQMWKLNGTPTDCIKLATDSLLPQQPDLVISGINHGSNTGNSVIYSGTMGAAIEGCLKCIPSIGFSLCSNHPTAEEFDSIMPYVTEITKKVLERGLPDGVCLNVNFPKGGNVKGYKRARACHGQWTEEYARYTDPDGKPFYILTGTYLNSEPEATDTDLYCIAHGYASVVPVVPDRDYTSPLAFFDQPENA